MPLQDHRAAANRAVHPPAARLRKVSLESKKERERVQRRTMGISVMALLLCSRMASAETVKLRLLSAGAGKQLSQMLPQEMKLSETQPAGVKKIPAGLAVPLYGTIALGPNPTTFTVLVD